MNKEFEIENDKSTLSVVEQSIAMQRLKNAYDNNAPDHIKDRAMRLYADAMQLPLSHVQLKLFPKQLLAGGMKGKYEQFMPDFADETTGWFYNGVWKNERTGEIIKVYQCEAERGYEMTEEAVVYSDDVWKKVSE